MDALGISGPEFFGDYLHQVVNVRDNWKNSERERYNAMSSAIIGIKPRDETEAMLIAQMVATHELAMTFARRSLIPRLSLNRIGGERSHELTRTYATQMAALKHYRTGGEQRVIVQRVDVREGGQAVVGDRRLR